MCQPLGLNLAIFNSDIQRNHFEPYTTRLHVLIDILNGALSQIEI